MSSELGPLFLRVTAQENLTRLAMKQKETKMTFSFRISSAKLSYGTYREIASPAPSASLVIAEVRSITLVSAQPLSKTTFPTRAWRSTRDDAPEESLLGDEKRCRCVPSGWSGEKEGGGNLEQARR